MLIIRNRYEIQKLAKKYHIPKVYDLLGQLKETNKSIAMTDGKHVYVNPQEFNELPAEDDFFILCHELLHIIYQHTDKTYYPKETYKNQELLNLCQDAVINTYLEKRLGYRQQDGIYLDNIARVLYRKGWITSHYLGYTGQLTTKNLYEYIENLMPDQDAMDDLLKEFPKVDDLTEPEDEFEQSSVSEELRAQISKSLGITEEVITKEHDNIQQPKPSTKTFDTPKTISANEMIKFISEYIGNNAVIRGRSRTYSRPSRRVNSSEFVLAGYKQYKNINKITIYLDTSGSMSHELVSNLFTTLKTLYQTTKFDLYQFTYDIVPVDLEKQNYIHVGGGTYIQRVLDKITEENADHSIIITDCYDNFSLKNIKNDLMIFTNNKSFKSDNDKVKLTYFC